MPYEVQLEDGMKIQVLSLNGHDWSDYREKIIRAAREARSATPALVYATVLAIIKSNQWPTTIYERQCLTRWQLCMGQRLQALGEATSEARDSEVPRAAMTQPHECQTACRQVHEQTTDTTTTHHEHAEPIVPVDGSCDPPDMPPEDGARHRAGEGVGKDGRTGAGGDNRVDHTKSASRQAANAATDAMNTHATHAEPTTPASTHTAPRRDANAGARDGVRAQWRISKPAFHLAEVTASQHHLAGPLSVTDLSEPVKLGQRTGLSLSRSYSITAWYNLPLFVTDLSKPVKLGAARALAASLSTESTALKFISFFDNRASLSVVRQQVFIISTYSNIPSSATTTSTTCGSSIVAGRSGRHIARLMVIVATASQGGALPVVVQRCPLHVVRSWLPFSSLARRRQRLIMTRTSKGCAMEIASLRGASHSRHMHVSR